MNKLVTYFSYSGVTQNEAERIAEELGADLFEIKPAEPYTAADVNWQDEGSRNVREYKDETARPAIAKAVGDLESYDTIYVGYPIWWYTHPRIINTFLESGDFSDKRIILFATSSSTGIEGSLEELRSTYPELDIAGGVRISGMSDIKRLAEM